MEAEAAFMPGDPYHLHVSSGYHDNVPLTPSNTFSLNSFQFQQLASRRTLQQELYTTLR
jgi:hypothetical protein